MGLVHQEYGIQATLTFGDGEPLELYSDTILELPNRYEKGFSPRVAYYINEGILVTPIS